MKQLNHMRALLSPVGILLANTLPVMLLMLLLGSTLSVIHPLLDAETITAWWWTGGTLAAVVLTPVPLMRSPAGACTGP